MQIQQGLNLFVCSNTLTWSDLYPLGILNIKLTKDLVFLVHLFFDASVQKILIKLHLHLCNKSVLVIQTLRIMAKL